MLAQITAEIAVEVMLTPDLARLPDLLKPDALEKSVGLMSQVSRPGTGGRQPRVPAGFESTATADLKRRLGSEPTVETHNGSRLELWEVNPEGDTVVGSRLSSDDVIKGENVMAQLNGALDLCEEVGLTPRYVLAATRMSGESSLENRLDLQFVMRAVEQGRVKSVVFREVDRLTRNPKVGENFFSFMKNQGANLYLTTERPNLVDWEEGMLLLRIKSGVAAHERSVISRRTFSAIERRMLLAGKGWPGSVKFGFRRDPQGFLEVDPEQWGLVERICFDYSRLGDTGRGSLTALVEHMKGLGCSFSREKIRQILRDPVYVNGEWSSTVNGIEYPCRPIEIPRPIPAGVHSRNISLLDNTKGRNSNATPYGMFLLNHIPFLHSRCMHEKVPKKRQTGVVDMRTPMLRGSNHNYRPRKRPFTYSHRPGSPEWCKGFAVDAQAVDEGVINALLELADSPELQLAYINGTSAARDVEEVVEDVDELKRRMGGLKRKHDALVRSYIDNPQGDKVSETRGIAALLAGVEQDMEALGNRIALAKASEKPGAKNPARNLRDEMERVLVLAEDSSDEERQRRAALVGSLLSKVVLHHGDNGLELELFGHLIPTGKMVVPADLQVQMRSKIDGSWDPSTKGSLSGRIPQEIDALLPQVPAWKSRRIRILDLAYQLDASSLQVIRHCVKFASDRLELGLLFAKEGRGISRYDELRSREFPELLGTSTLLQGAQKHGFTSEEMIRDALGVEDALLKRRVKPRSGDDMRFLIRRAFEDGMSWGPDLKGRWEEVERRVTYLDSWSSARYRARQVGSDLGALIEEVANELDLVSPGGGGKRSP